MRDIIYVNYWGGWVERRGMVMPPPMKFSEGGGVYWRDLYFSRGREDILEDGLWMMGDGGREVVG